MKNPTLEDSFPVLNDAAIPENNRKIFNQLKKYTDDINILAACLIQKPGEETDFDEIREKFNNKVAGNLEKLQKLFALDKNLLKNIGRNHKIAILFVLDCGYLAENSKPKKALIKYAMQILQKLHMGELRVALEDKFFNYLEPKTYNHYKEILKFNEGGFKELEKEIINHFDAQLRKNRIHASLKSRIKTIYSIHNKVTKKNILLSQVLDTFGLRIIVPTIEDCYKTMGLILKEFPVMSCRIKDYISIPKDNGYQSIHLTVFHKEHPTEIQIRTNRMHKYAQYGKACHLTYKKYES